MKKIVSKQMAVILCCSGMLSAHAAKFEPAASWSAKPNDSTMTYNIKDNAKSRYVDDKRAVYNTFNQISKAETGAYFSTYRCRFKAELPTSLWKKK